VFNLFHNGVSFGAAIFFYEGDDGALDDNLWGVVDCLGGFDLHRHGLPIYNVVDSRNAGGTHFTDGLDVFNTARISENMDARSCLVRRDSALGWS